MPTPRPQSWPLLPVPDETGRLAWPDLDESVVQSLQILLQTRPGERRMRPRFGAGLQAFLGAPDDLLTRSRIRDAVTQAVNAWEPRVLLDEVIVEDGPALGHVRVELRFRLRRTGAGRRLGLTLALENG